MFLLGILDFLFVSHAYHSVLTRGASVQLVFGFEVKLVERLGGAKLRWDHTCCEQPFKGFLSTCGVSTPILATREQPSFSSCPPTLLNDCRRAQKRLL